MANVRGFGDYAPQHPAPTDEESQALVNSPLPPISQVLCPDYRVSLSSFIFLVTVLDLVYFVTTLVVAQVKFGHAFVSSNTMVGPEAAVFLYLGAKYTPDILDGQVYRLLLPVFMHGGLIHLLFNLFFQCNLGFRYEKAWGVGRLATLYLVAGIGGNLLSAIQSPHSISVGASGALFGLLGGQVAYLFFNWSEIPSAGMALCSVVFIIIINLLLGFSGVVDTWAHLGGLLSGLAVGLSFPAKYAGSFSARDMVYRYVGMAATTAYFVVTVLVLTLGTSLE